MNSEVVTQHKGDATGKIKDLEDFLKRAKDRGATHYRMVWSQDPKWAFKWFEAFRYKTQAEKDQEEIESLEKRLNELKNKKSGS